MGHKPLGVCSDTLYRKAQPRNLAFPKALVALGTQGGCGKMLPACGHVLSVQLDSQGLGAPRVHRAWGLLTIMAALRTYPGMGIAEINFGRDGTSGSQLLQLYYLHTFEGKIKTRKLKPQ